MTGAVSERGVIEPDQRPLAAPGGRHSTFHPLRVAAIEPLTDDAVALSFEVPAELRAAYAWEPGQHVTVRLAAIDDGRRSYSICSPPSSGRLRVGIKQIPGGAFSTHVTAGLRVGDEIEVMTPAGRFTPRLDPEQARHYAAIVAGSGITPVLAIISAVLEVEPHSRVTLVYGNRTSDSIMFLEELEDLKDRYRERLQLVHVLSREEQEAELLFGRIDAGRLARLLDALLPPETVDQWYLCGPQEMVDAARELLLDRGVAAASVHRELFHVGPAPVRQAAAVEPTGGAKVTMILDGRRSTFRVAGERLLDAALRVRRDTPYSCTNGMCGTCRARVLAGTVEMDHNYALESDELAAGLVLTCQAVPTSDEVVVDYDV